MIVIYVYTKIINLAAMVAKENNDYLVRVYLAVLAVKDLQPYPQE